MPTRVLQRWCSRLCSKIEYCWLKPSPDYAFWRWTQVQCLFCAAKSLSGSHKQSLLCFSYSSECFNQLKIEPLPTHFEAILIFFVSKIYRIKTPLNCLSRLPSSWTNHWCHWSWFQISIYQPFPGKMGLLSYPQAFTPAMLIDFWNAF